MQRVSHGGWLFLSALFMTGCPVFPDDPRGCLRDSHCRSGYVCDAEVGECYPATTLRSCDEPSDCDADAGQICGADGRCHRGSCAISGCVAGYVCDGSSGTFVCVEDDAGSAGAGGVSGAGGSSAVGGAGGVGGGGVAGAGAMSGAGGSSAGAGGVSGAAGQASSAGAGGTSGAAGGLGVSGGAP